jgi:signal peptide peptidase SppA
MTLDLPFARTRDPIVPVLRLAGLIGGVGFARGLSLERLARPIRTAFETRRAVAVALAINSPGGSPVQSALIARRIRDLADETGKPVFAFVEDVAASGGYWLACAADEIWADSSSIVGSIGVVSAGFGFQDAIGRLGIERRVHTAGERKAILDPFRPEEPADVAKLLALQAEIHDAFKAHVRERRGTRLAGDDAVLFSGEFWSGTQGKALGLVDGIGHMRGVLQAKFGRTVDLRAVGGERGWLRRRLGLDGLAEGLPAAVLAAAEDRALWQRYGL